MKKRRISVLTVMLLAVSLMTTLAWGQGPVVKVEGGMIHNTKIEHDYGFLRISKKQVLLQEV